MDEPEDTADARSNMVRIMALNAIVMGLIKTHPDLQALRDVAEQYAEASRVTLMNQQWTDEQVAAFDRAFDRFSRTLPHPSAK